MMPTDFQPCAPGFVTNDGHIVVGWGKDPSGRIMPVVFRDGELKLARTARYIWADLT